MKIFLPDCIFTDPGYPRPDLSGLPYFSRLLRGIGQWYPYHSLWETLRSEPLPAMAPAMLQQEMPQAPPGYWLRADPVILQATLDNLLLLPGDTLQLTQAESDALILSLNALFVEDGLRFYAVTPSSWYVHVKEAPKIQCVDLPYAQGRQIDKLLPHGEQALIWHRYMNEIQMLFYTHPVNETRSLAGRKMVSGVWFWGGGIFPLANAYQSSETLYGAETSLYARALGYQTSAFPDDWQEACHQCAIWSLPGLAILQHEGVLAWETMLKHYEQTAFQTAFFALKSRKITSITLILPAGEKACVIKTRRQDLWKWWRSRLPTLNNND
jgi:hypothetical protein